MAVQVHTWTEMNHQRSMGRPERIRRHFTSVVIKTLWYKPEGRFETRWVDFFFFFFFPIYLIRPAALGPGVHSASKRNEYRKQKKKIWGLGRGRCVGLTTIRSSVNQLSRQCGILNISQPIGLHGHYGDSFYLWPDMLSGPMSHLTNEYRRLFPQG
jgi:hypothetical protein